MEYITDYRDFPKQYTEGVNVELCDTCENTFSSSKGKFKEPCDNFRKTFIS